MMNIFCYLRGSAVICILMVFCSAVFAGGADDIRILKISPQDREIETVIIRLVDGKQKIERMRKTGEQSQTILAPAEKDKRTEQQQNSFN